MFLALRLQVSCSAHCCLTSLLDKASQLRDAASRMCSSQSFSNTRVQHLASLRPAQCHLCSAGFLTRRAHELGLPCSCIHPSSFHADLTSKTGLTPTQPQRLSITSLIQGYTSLRARLPLPSASWRLAVRSSYCWPSRPCQNCSLLGEASFNSTASTSISAAVAAAAASAGVVAGGSGPAWSAASGLASSFTSVKVATCGRPQTDECLNIWHSDRAMVSSQLAVVLAEASVKVANCNRAELILL